VPENHAARLPFRLLAVLVASCGALAVVGLVRGIFNEGVSLNSFLRSLALLFVVWFSLPMAWVALTGRLRRSWPGFGYGESLESEAAGRLLSDPTSSLVGRKEFVLPSSEFGVEVLNDASTPMDFVVDQLIAHAGMARDEAVQTMLRIHTQGGALIPLPTEAEATTAAARISQAAVESRHPLVCRFADFRKRQGNAGAL
jgi:ATP-dependent Clp protease adaptor protein ClpS